MEQFSPNKREVKTAQPVSNEDIKRLVYLDIEAKLLGGNPKDKYVPGSLKDDTESYSDKVARLAEAALANPDSEEVKRAKKSLEATFTN